MAAEFGRGKIQFVDAGPCKVEEVREKAARVIIEATGEVKWIPLSVMSTPTRKAMSVGRRVPALKVKDWFADREALV